jgi:flavin reductase
MPAVTRGSREVIMEQAAQAGIDAEPTVPRDVFRQGMSRLAAAVNIITTGGPAGRCGFTASAVCSVTDDPPTLLVCMNRGSIMHAAFKENGVIAVNTLGAGQEDLSATFAGARGRDPRYEFPEEHWFTLATGAPILREALVAFDCRIDESKDVGTHSIFFCRVLDISFRTAGQGSGLIYYDRAYRTWIPA